MFANRIRILLCCYVLHVCARKTKRDAYPVTLSVHLTTPPKLAERLADVKVGNENSYICHKGIMIGA